MIVYVDARQMAMCDVCFKRFERDKFPGTQMIETHVCNDCAPANGAVAASAATGAWCGTPALSRTWAQGQENV